MCKRVNSLFVLVFPEQNVESTRVVQDPLNSCGSSEYSTPSEEPNIVPTQATNLAPLIQLLAPTTDVNLLVDGPRQTFTLCIFLQHLQTLQTLGTHIFGLPHITSGPLIARWDPLFCSFLTSITPGLPLINGQISCTCPGLTRHVITPSKTLVRWKGWRITQKCLFRPNTPVSLCRTLLRL